MSLPLLPVCLANVAIESLLYGIFFILNAVSLVLALQFLSRRQPGTSLGLVSYLKHMGSVLRKPMFIGSAPLFITVTAVSSMSCFSPPMAQDDFERYPLTPSLVALDLYRYPEFRSFHLLQGRNGTDELLPGHIPTHLRYQVRSAFCVSDYQR